MITLKTDDPRATGRIAFCMTGRVVKADVGLDHILLTFNDGRTASIAGCYLEVLFDFPGTQQEALLTASRIEAKSISVELEAAGSAEQYAEGTAITEQDPEPPSASR